MNLVRRFSFLIIVLALAAVTASIFAISAQVPQQKQPTPPPKGQRPIVVMDPERAALL